MIAQNAKELGRRGWPHNSYHEYHERSREEFGLQMDSTEVFFRSRMVR